jgi:hypothetical protein
MALSGPMWEQGRAGERAIKAWLQGQGVFVLPDFLAAHRRASDDPVGGSLRPAAAPLRPAAESPALAWADAITTLARRSPNACGKAAEPMRGVGARFRDDGNRAEEPVRPDIEWSCRPPCWAAAASGDQGALVPGATGAPA